MDRHRIRNIIPPVYGVLVIVGFLISATVGLIVLLGGAMLSGLLWSTLSGGGSVPAVGRRSDRTAARAARRAGRR
jgi:hypothetical protein